MIYGKDVKSTSVEIAVKDFLEVFKKAGETSIVELELGNDKKPVLIHNVQKNPVTDSIIHVDFYQVNLKQKVTANIPVELVGESPAEKQALGTVVQYLTEIEVEALPTDLPDKFEIDATIFTEVDKAFLVKNLKVDKTKVELKVDSEQIIAKVEALKVEEEPTPEPVAEVPAEGEEATQDQAKEGESAEDKTSTEPQK